MRVSKTPVFILCSVILFIISVVGYMTYKSFETSEVAVVSFSPTPSPAVSITEISTVSPIPITSSGPQLSRRLEYVRDQLIAAGFNAAAIDNLLLDKRKIIYPVQQVAYKKPNWEPIKQKLYSDFFVQKGKEYLKTHQLAFDIAERDFGIPREVLAGIVAIETEFGHNTGTTITFNALYSRVERWPESSWKAQANQLAALSNYCLKTNLDCFGIKGSYAGALGIVQFMPYSLLTWGIDGNQDGRINLYDPIDAIPSAANFLIAHGWKDDQTQALARYYGSSEGYPEIVLTYASLLKNR